MAISGGLMDNCMLGKILILVQTTLKAIKHHRWKGDYQIRNITKLDRDIYNAKKFATLRLNFNVAIFDGNIRFARSKNRSIIQNDYLSHNDNRFYENNR